MIFNTDLRIMKERRRSVRSKTMLAVLAVVVLASWLAQPQAWAQKETPYPTRQISYLICFDPGGQSDRVARLQQPHLTGPAAVMEEEV
jgi:tripartite-type tricarboxylate transporter receptor subunit TctC